MSQTDIAVKCKPVIYNGITCELQWKEGTAQWEDGRSGNTVSVDAGGKTCQAHQASPLEPGTMFGVRLSVKDATDQPGTPGSIGAHY
jgi:hypothetical protein